MNSVIGPERGTIKRFSRPRLATSRTDSAQNTSRSVPFDSPFDVRPAPRFSESPAASQARSRLPRGNAPTGHLKGSVQPEAGPFRLVPNEGRGGGVIREKNLSNHFHAPRIPQKVCSLGGASSPGTRFASSDASHTSPSPQPGPRGRHGIPHSHEQVSGNLSPR